MPTRSSSRPGPLSATPRVLRLLGLATPLALALASPAVADLDVTISTVTDVAEGIRPGEVLEVRVEMTYDGANQAVGALAHRVLFDRDVLTYTGFSFSAQDHSIWNASPAGGFLTRALEPGQNYLDFHGGRVRTFYYAAFGGAVEGPAAYETVTQNLFFTVGEEIGLTTLDQEFWIDGGFFGATVANSPHTTTSGGPLSFYVIPEPGTALLLGIGLAGLSRRRLERTSVRR